jgi:processive 1,2-diacylglycerol beta-glucosyltransferase
VPWRTRLRTLFNRINAAEFLLYLRRFRPDVAVCTHFLPLEVMAGLTRRPPGRHLYCAVTDFAAHSLWMVRRVARYYVATEEARRQLIRRGQPEQGVRVLGIPVDPAFAGRADAHRVRSRLGLRPDLFTVLMVSGGFGMGAVHELLRVFQNSHLRCQFIVVAGTNEKLRRRVTAVSRDMGQPVAVLGFVDCMHELMDASDLVVTKPGGLSTAEALAKGLPMLLTDPIPGQEQRNCEHLLENGAAQRLFEVADAPHRVRQFIENPGLLDGMRSRSRALGRPDAARNIARDILSTVSG